MKLIDLLNKIANNEALPKKIKFYDDLFELYQVEQYGEIYTDYKCVIEGTMLFKDEIIKVTMLLNDEVEVVEEENMIAIPESEYLKYLDYINKEKE